MPSSYTSLLGLVLPVQGELQGTWGDTVNNELTSLVDSAVAGTTTLNTDSDVTLTDTTGAANQSRQAIILWTASGTVTRNITAPARSKPYIVINATGSTQSIVIRGVGPTTGVTLAAGEKAVVVWNGSDFVKVSTSTAGDAVLAANNAFTGANTFYNATGQTFGTATAAQDGIILAGRAGGSSTYRVTMQPGTLTGNKTATFPDETFTVGFRNIPAVADKTAAYTLAVGDIGKVVGVGTGGSIEIPNSTFAAGDAVLLFNNTSAGITITCTITTAYIAGTDADKATVTLATRGVANILFISGTACVITGNVS